MTPRDHAADLLGIPRDAKPEAARAALLSRLFAEEFVPPEKLLAAVNTFSDAKLPVTPQSDEDVYELRNEIQQFIGKYWDIPPSERNIRWAGLYARAVDHSTRTYLKYLKLGLDIDAREPILFDQDAIAENLENEPGSAGKQRLTTTEQNNLTQFAGVVRELFVLPPRSRAVRRLEWLEENNGSLDIIWAQRQFQKYSPAHADLMAVLTPGKNNSDVGFKTAEFSPAYQVTTQPLTMNANPIVGSTLPSYFNNVISTNDGIESEPASRQRKKKNIDDDDRSRTLKLNPYLWVFIVMLGSVLFKSCAGLIRDNSSRSPSYNSSPFFDRDKANEFEAFKNIQSRIPKENVRPPSTIFKSEDVAKFEAFEKLYGAERARFRQDMPKGYLFWCASGRPKAADPAQPPNPNNPKDPDE